MTAGVELALRYPSARLVYTGGSAALLGERRPEAVSARNFWLSLGVPAERMTFEDKSRNTWENSVFARDLVNPNPGETWLLVTSAWHMPRSIGIFRRAGFDVIPYPAAYHTYEDVRDYLPSPFMSGRVFMLDSSVREWAGPLAYWMAGKSDALFPAP
ncbi:MAG: YdcF family protein [Beijerinckiaceae bacterium]|nr:YdcF family protein [Beijerinckiaceae bacterium]MCI0737309.1 YdcF family protein [Beijerinckiaceae bacterium]